MTDQELNQLYASNSNKGQFSTNPYTYGDWLDISLGYTPPRFIVFRVDLYNYTLPKIELVPDKAVCIVDQKQKLFPYGLYRSVNSYNSFVPK